MRKIALTVILSTGLIGLIITACRCKDVLDYWKPTSFTAQLTNINDSYVPYQENDTVYSDSVYIELNFEMIYLAENTNSNYSYFTNAAFATPKCPVNGHRGLKNEVVDFKMTSDQPFDSIPAGADLSHLVYYNDQALSSNDSLLFNEISNRIASEYSNPVVSILFKDKPTNQSLRSFELEWTFASAEKIKANTQAVVW
ncbi:MAG: hypothetical protein WED10_06565 [Brumimicrobium sp.]